MKEEDLQAHIVSTYFSLRRGMIVVALACPIAVVLWGKLWHVEWQNSISAYYFAPNGGNWTYSPYPVRALFAGMLFALGTFLYLYKGFSNLENWLLNLAGVSAIVVALSPMIPEKGYIPLSGMLHYAAAVTLFVCIGLTAIFCNEFDAEMGQGPPGKAAVQTRLPVDRRVHDRLSGGRNRPGVRFRRHGQTSFLDRGGRHMGVFGLLDHERHRAHADGGRIQGAQGHAAPAGAELGLGVGGPSRLTPRWSSAPARAIPRPCGPSARRRRAGAAYLLMPLKAALTTSPPNGRCRRPSARICDSSRRAGRRGSCVRSLRAAIGITSSPAVSAASAA